jgi:hypothetical protein
MEANIGQTLDLEESTFWYRHSEQCTNTTDDESFVPSAAKREEAAWCLAGLVTCPEENEQRWVTVWERFELKANHLVMLVYVKTGK